jgi:ABC-2 type transport system permease protein
MKYARAILWAQWRTFRNFYPRSRVGLTALVGIVWYGVWAGIAVAVAAVLSSAPMEQITMLLPGFLLLALLYWQVVPVLLAAAGASLELRKLQIYPIPIAQLFGVEVMLRVTAAVEVLLVLCGVIVGTIRNPVLPAWGVLALAPFIAFNLLLGVGLRDAIARILARRRIREVAFFLLILSAALPRFFFMRGGHVPAQITGLLSGEAWAGWPWIATAHLLMGQEVPISIGAILAWCGAAGAFGYWQFTRTLTFDAEAARTRPAVSSVRAVRLDRLFRLPSAVLADPLGVLVEKEVRFLSRSPRFRLVFLMGFTFGLLIWLPVAMGRGENSQSFLGSNYLTVISVYSLLLLGEACFWNSFGFDRSAAQIYFLAPVPFSRVLIAKNLTALIFITLEIGMIALVCLVLGMPLDARRLVEAFAVGGVISILLLSAGNVLSVRQPRAANPSASFRTAGSGRVQAVLFVVYPIVFAPVALAYLARYAFDSQAAFFGMLALDAIGGLVLYKVALESAMETAERSKEKIIEALSRGDGPIAA